MTSKTKAAWLTGGSSTALAAAIALSIAGIASAQTAPATPAAAGGDAAGNQVVVTGSRIARTGFTTPVPVTVIGQDQIDAEAATSVGTVVQDLPEFRPQQNAISAAANTQNVGATTADLRGLGANRTLVLVDGERVVGDTVPGGLAVTGSDAVDLNLLPTSMVLRTEIVTGGASAQYGSDAVGGVVNIILDNKMNGFKGQVQYSETQYGDGVEYDVSAAYGHEFAGGKGHFVISGDYVDNEGSLSRLDNGRNWSTQQNLPAGISNPCPGAAPKSAACPTGGNGLPATIVGSNGENSSYTLGGVIMPAGLPGTSTMAPFSNPLEYLNFNSPTSVAPLVFGSWLGKGSGMLGGQGPNGFNEFFPFEVPVTHYSFYGHGNYDFNDDLSAHVSVMYGDNKAVQESLQPRWFGTNSTNPPSSGINNLWIYPDNAYLPASVAALMPTYAPTGFNLGVVNDADGPSIARNDRSTVRITAGLDGKFNFLGARPWTWSAYYQYGETDNHFSIANEVNWQHQDLQWDAVTVTPANVGASGLAVGSIACRSTLTNPTNGCVPMNPFGNAPPSAAARAYGFGTQWDNTKRVEHVISASTQGDLFNLPAGPVTLAAGGEYRYDSLWGNEDPISAGKGAGLAPGVNGWQISEVVFGNGSMDVKEGFAELAIPILKDVLLFKNFNADVAARETDYNLSGAVTTWKASLSDDVFSWLRLRGALSRDIRAPNVWDLFTHQNTSLSLAADPLTGGAFAQTTTGGNPNLTPEVAYTVTGGFVVTAPSDTFLRGLRFSVDYNRIKLDNAITSLSAATVVTNCVVLHNAANCALITRAAPTPQQTALGEPGSISNIQATNVNIASQTESGIDVELDYRRPLGDFVAGLPGTVDFHLLGTHTMQLVQSVSGANTYIVGTSAGVPWWELNGQLSYSVGNLTIGGTGRFISDSIISYTSYAQSCQSAMYAQQMAIGATTTTSYNCVGSYAIFGLNATYNIDYKGGRIQLFSTIDNIFDRPPPFDVATTGSVTGSAPNYDVLGRNFHFGIRLRY